MAQRTRRERIREIIELPYVRLPLVASILLLIGLALIYLIALMASVYALAVLFGVPTIQIVIGIFSATGTLASASVGFLLYRNSVKGAEITVALEDPLEAEMEYRVRRTLATGIPSGIVQELSERLRFAFPLVWLNGGPRGGAITNVELKLVKPLGPLPTTNKGWKSEDNISVGWTMNIAKPEDRIDLNSVRLPLFSGGLQNSMSIASNESMAVVAEVDLFLMDKQKEVRPPVNSWIKVQKDTPQFEFKLTWKTASKDRLKSNEKSFKVRPTLNAPIQEGPAAVVE